jgi:hypothetical protein
MRRRYPPPGALDEFDSAELAAGGYAQPATQAGRIIACIDQPRGNWNAGSRIHSAGPDGGLEPVSIQRGPVRFATLGGGQLTAAALEGTGLLKPWLKERVRT